MPRPTINFANRKTEILPEFSNGITKQELTHNQIRTDGGTQMRANMSEATLQEYTDAWLEGVEFPSITVFFDGFDYWLGDGFHRKASHARAFAGEKSILCDIRQGTQRDAILYSVGANSKHGLRRTNEDKRRAVVTLINDTEWGQWSNREIARRCGVDEKTVRNFRNPQPMTDLILVAELPQQELNHATESQNSPSIRKFISHHGTVGERTVASHRGAPTPKQSAAIKTLTAAIASFVREKFLASGGSVAEWVAYEDATKTIIETIEN